MKKTSLLSSTFCLVLVAIVSLTSSCKKEDLKRSLTLNQQTLSFHANAKTADGSDYVLIDSTINSQLSQTLADNDISIDKITSVKLKSCVLRIADNSVADGITFDGYQYASAHIKAGLLDEQQLAFKTVIPQTQLTEFSFDSQDGELLDYLKQNNLEIRVQAHNLVDMPATDYVLDISYNVDYNIAK